MTILITGSEGLIGRAVSAKLAAQGHEIIPFDIKNTPRDDICDVQRLSSAIEKVDGIIHLAAISRVVWAQQDPTLCQNTNEVAFENLIKRCLMKTTLPWIIFSSSREVYGQQHHFPVSETATLSPVNVYARSKVFGEQLMSYARAHGMVSNILRLSNVYGCEHDHHDRVIPAFARAASTGGELRVEGKDNIFDFTHIDDVSTGIVQCVEQTAQGMALPTLHLVSGQATTLGGLANLAINKARKPLVSREYESRNYDVGRFVGNPENARTILGWQAQTTLEQGLSQLIEKYVQQNSHA
jgi:UDP-glucose 4-epimerase